MSYLDARIDNSARIKSALVVGSIHAAIGVGLVVGLTVSGVIPDIEDPFEGVIIETPPEDLPVPPPVDPMELVEPLPVPPVAPDSPIDLTKNVPVDVAPFDPGLIVDVVIKTPAGSGDIIAPEIPQPKPLYTPKAAAPRNGPQGWISNDDYPTRDIRRGNEGVVGYRLVIGSDGKVDSCDIVASSGHAGLDQTTCTLLQKRAKFNPATNGEGARTTGTFAGKVNWQIPE